MRAWFISDTHNQHEDLQVPAADLVIHCGDEAMHKDPAVNEPEARRFFEWYCSLDIPLKIFVPGNHSTAIESGLITPEDFPKVHFLIHDGLDLDGIKFFGSPWVPSYHDWAYMKKRTRLDTIWQTVPEDTDVLITHGPPRGILDLTHDRETRELVQAGCSALRRHVQERVRPKIHAFGHMHDERGICNFGMFIRGGTRYMNCSVCNLKGEYANNGFLLDL